METSANEWKELIERIKAPRFLRTKDQRALLDFFFENMAKQLSAKDIEIQHFGYGTKDHRHDPGHSRGAILALNGNLKKYFDANPEEKWICEIPSASERGGYRLEFTEKKKTPKSPTELFWRPHLENAKDVLVVGNTLLFFYDASMNCLLRHRNINIGVSKKEAMEALETSYPQGYSESLEIKYPYESVGESNAYDVLARWFHEHTGILIERRRSRQVIDEDIQDLSPIILGRPPANRFMKTILSSKAASRLAYRFDEERQGAVRISPALTDTEEKALSRLSVNGNLVEPSRNWETVFGILWRVSKPGGGGAVTIIGSEFNSLVEKRIIELLTDERRTADLFPKMNWSLDSDAPKSFEMLFVMEANPGDLEGGGPAEFLCGRTNVS
jgi:hypothetical protein